MSDDSLFREVDEEVRRDQFMKLWDRFGTYIIAVSLAVIIVVAGVKGWQYWQTRQAEAAGAAYHQALALVEDGKLDEARPIFADVAAEGHEGYAQLARLQLAGILAQQGKTDEAVATYDAVARDAAVDQELRDVARIRAGYLLAESASPEALQERLVALDAANSPWRNAAREILAAAHYRTGNYAEADRLMNEILADPQAPAAMRQRAEMMVQLLQPELGAKSAAVN